MEPSILGEFPAIEFIRWVAGGARNAEANHHVCNHRSRRGDRRPLRRSCSSGTAIRLAAVLPLPVRLLSTFVPEAAAVRQHVLPLRAFHANPGVQQKLVQLLPDGETVPQRFALHAGRLLTDIQPHTVPPHTDHCSAAEAVLHIRH